MLKEEGLQLAKLAFVTSYRLRLLGSLQPAGTLGGKREGQLSSRSETCSAFFNFVWLDPLLDFRL